MRGGSDQVDQADSDNQHNRYQLKCLWHPESDRLIPSVLSFELIIAPTPALWFWCKAGSDKIT